MQIRKSTLHLITALIVLGLYSTITTYKLITDQPQIVTHTDTIPGDLVYKDTIIYKPKPYSVIVRDTFYTPVDSAQCVADYLALWKKCSSIKQYVDTLRNDTSMTVVVGSTVTNNTVQNYLLHSKNNRRTVINTTNVTYKNKLPMLSVGLTYDLHSLVPYGTLRLNNNLYLVGGYNLTVKSPMVGLQYTIFSK